MIFNHTVIHTIDAYCARFPDASGYVQDLRQLLEKGIKCTSRSEFRGHITCSALVFNSAEQLLMIHHRTLNRWLLPGGHVEDEDISLPAAAMRELSEEADVSADQITADERWGHVPVHIDRHTIPANPAKGEPAHEHWDFCYPLHVATIVATPQPSEIIEVKWCNPHMHSDSRRLLSVIEKSRAVLGPDQGEDAPAQS